MIKGSGESSTNADSDVMETAHYLVSEVIEKAKEEVMKRKSVSQPHTDPEPTPLRRLSQWQNRAQGAFRRFLTSICVRIQEITK